MFSEIASGAKRITLPETLVEESFVLSNSFGVVSELRQQHQFGDFDVISRRRHVRLEGKVQPVLR